MNGRRSESAFRRAGTLAGAQAFAWLGLILLSGCASSSVRHEPESSTGGAAAAAPRLASAGQFTLGQSWLASPQADLQPTRVSLTWMPEALRVRARLCDQLVDTKVDGDNQRTWELGDVFEIFVMVEGGKYYDELHVTPHNHRTHFRLPLENAFMSEAGVPTPLEDLFVSPIGFSSSVQRGVDAWLVEVSIPAALLGRAGLRVGDLLRISFARYDYGSAEEPMISASAKHSRLDFHRPGEWHLVRLENDGSATIVTF